VLQKENAVEEKKGLTGEHRYWVHGPGYAPARMHRQNLRILEEYPAMRITQCALVIEGPEWVESDGRGSEDMTLCEACGHHEGWATTREASPAPILYVRLESEAHGPSIWHVSDPATTPSLEAKTLCALPWGGDGWRMRSGAAGVPDVICGLCCNKLARARASQPPGAVTSAPLAGGARVGPASLEPAARAELRALAMRILESHNVTIDASHGDASHGFASAVLEYLRAVGAMLEGAIVVREETLCGWAERAKCAQIALDLSKDAESVAIRAGQLQDLSEDILRVAEGKRS
jgi:hypothetical protein